MKQQLINRWRFFFRVIFPALLVIILFVIAFYAIILPMYERSIMDRKAEMIRELTSSAASILSKYYQEEQKGILTESQAQQEAVSRIEYLRYGSEGKDYFWITDMHPNMIMHPYRKDLNGKDLTGFSDPKGKHLFVEFVHAVRDSEQGYGYVDYMWQWKDDSTLIVPKLSYVMAFKPWGWVIGTGIYLEDVRAEIRSLEKGLLLITLGIALILLILMVIIAAQSYRIEQKRVQAEEETRHSEAKYRTLVEATSEGMVMLLDRRVVYSNRILQDLTGCGEKELAEKGIQGILVPAEAEKVFTLIGQLREIPSQPVTIETQLVTQTGEPERVALSISLVPFGDGLVHVIKVKPVVDLKPITGLSENLISELQSSLLFLSQPVGSFLKKMAVCEIHQSIQEAAIRIRDQKGEAILVTTSHGDPIAIVTDKDICRRAVAAGIRPDQPVYHIMSSPLVTISDKALLFEAVALMQEKEISHLPIKTAAGMVTGMVSARDLLRAHQYSFSFVKQEIERANSAGMIRQVAERIPELISGLLNSGAEPGNLVRLTSLVFEASVDRLITLAIRQLGEPPVPFVFMVMGSAGREEQTLATDQDNAIVFEDVDPENLEEVRSWFLHLGTLVCDWCNEAGYHYCPGKIMASNQEWCQPLSIWKKYFSKWITSAEPQDLLDINIFFDFRPAYGKRELTADLHAHIREVIRKHPSFFIYMTGNIQKLKPPLGLFGNIVVGSSKDQPDAFNIKKAMLPIVDMARLYALREGIGETNTLGRLSRLHHLGVFTDDQFRDREEAYKHLLMMRFRHQAEQLTSGIPVDNYINPEKITHIEQVMLKKIFGQISEFTGKLVMDFKGGIT